MRDMGIIVLLRREFFPPYFADGARHVNVEVETVFRRLTAHAHKVVELCYELGAVLGEFCGVISVRFPRLSRNWLLPALLSHWGLAEGYAQVLFIILPCVEVGSEVVLDLKCHFNVQLLVVK